MKTFMHEKNEVFQMFFIFLILQNNFNIFYIKNQSLFYNFFPIEKNQIISFFYILFIYTCLPSFHLFHSFFTQS